jgi:hypothetical protein
VPTAKPPRTPAVIRPLSARALDGIVAPIVAAIANTPKAPRIPIPFAKATGTGQPRDGLTLKKRTKIVKIAFTSTTVAGRRDCVAGYALARGPIQMAFSDLPQ